MNPRIPVALALIGLSVTAAQGPATIKVGAVTSLTGRFADFGRQQKAGIEAGLREVNARGINGAKLEVLLEDDASDTNKALAAAERLANAGVPLVMGAYSSTITKPMTQYLARAKVPVLVQTSSDDSITKPGGDYIYRLNQPASSYAEVLFDMFQDVGVKTVAVLAGNGAFEKSVHTAALDLAKARGIQVVGNQAYDKGLTDFRPILNGFKARNPDAVFLVGYQEDSVGVMRQAKEVGLNPKVFAGAAAGFALPEFIAGAGPASEYVVTATAWVPEMKTPNNNRLYVNLVNALGGTEPSYHAAQAYAGVIVAADALRRAGPGADREAVRKALDATNLQTAYGPIRFTDFSGFKNQNNLKMVAQQVQRRNGKLVFVPVYPTSLFSTKLEYPTPAWDRR